MEITSIIIKPKITEKTQAAKTFFNPKMAFYVNSKSNKNQISEAFRVLFGVKPSCVNVINVKPSPTRVTSRSRKNYTKSFKIAYITVSSSDYLEFQSRIENSEKLDGVLEETKSEVKEQ